MAGALGFFGASLAPEPPAPEFDTTSLTSAIEANAETLASLAKDVEAWNESPVGADIEAKITALTGSLDSLTESVSTLQSEIADAQVAFGDELTALDTRILALETAVPTAGDLASGDELAALRTRISEMTAAAEEQLAAAQSEAASVARAAEEARLAAEAEAEAARAAAAEREAELQAMAVQRETLISLRSAVVAGAPFSELLGSLGDVPAVLTANADTGVPTIQVLQRNFPDAARAALAQATAVDAGAGAGERLAAFLQRRINARSLTPQEGDGPDAVLSRAEANVMRGDLEAALSELQALPENGLSAMASWLEQAQTRISAIEAVDQLSATN